MLSLLLLSTAALAGPGLTFDDEELESIDSASGDTAFDVEDPQAVTGGVVVDHDRWLGTAAIGFRGDSIECTGVLVAPQAVLTAGHCAGGIQSVTLGANNYLRDEGERIAVSREIPYPNWARSYDVTLLLLAEPATTPPRIIAQDCILDEEYLYEGADVVVVGWGAYDTWGNEYDARLREGFITVDDPDCENLRRGCVASISPGGEIGAGIAVDGVDSCYGDSGGPLYLPTDRGDFVIGLTSRGYDTVTVPCGEGGIYVRPDAIIDWIEEEAGVTLERPDCSPPNAAPAPTAPDLEVRKNHSGSVKISPNDPDAGQGHSLEILSGPVNGTATVDSALKVTYTPDKGYTGSDSFVVEVFDDAESPLSGTVTVNVTVTGRCGCASSPATDPSGWALGALALLGLVRTRRRG